MSNLWLDAYVILVCIACVFIVWTMSLISHSAFLGIAEPPFMRELRRGSLAIMAIGMIMAVRWHVETGRPPWTSEVLVAFGLNLYLSLAICSTYVRMKRMGIKL